MRRSRSPSSGGHPVSQGRVGFTLLEVLAALGLSIILMYAVYSGVSLYCKLSITGRAEAAEAQLVRSLLKNIERDLRAAVYQAPAETASATTSSSTSSSASATSSSSSSSGSTSSSSTSSNSTDSSTTDAGSEEAGLAAGSGLFGNATTIMVHLSRPARELAFSPAVDSAAASNRTSELRTVAYFVGGQQGGQLQSMVREPGLIRLEGDRLAMNLADSQNNLAMLAAQMRNLAAEVVQLQFRYFDGFNWRADWDSQEFGGLPRAVEVYLEVTATNASVRADSRETLKTKVVIALPQGNWIDTSTIP